jgi:hypothetical protein
MLGNESPAARPRCRTRAEEQLGLFGEVSRTPHKPEEAGQNRTIELATP